MEHEAIVFSSDGNESKWKDKINWWIQDRKYDINNFIIRKCLSQIRKRTDSGIVKKAKQEFKAIGYYPESDEEDPNKWIQENVIDLLTVFSSQGHSGFSAPYCIEYFRKLANHEPLSPIQCTAEEWVDVSEYSGKSMFQNKRLSSIFKNGMEGKPYYLDAIIFKDQDGCTFTSNDCDGISSRQFIKLPFIPKTFYIDVISKEWVDQSETEEKEGGGWWSSKIKDRKQLWEVFTYYENPETA